MLLRVGLLGLEFLQLRFGGVQLGGGLGVALLIQALGLVLLLGEAALPLVPLAAQAVGAGAELVQLLAEGSGLVQALAQGFLSGFQLRDLAGFVEPPAVEPGFQTVVGLGKRDVLLAGGDQGGDLFLQLLALAHGQVRLLEKDRAVKDLLAQAREQLPGGFRRHPIHGQTGLLPAGGELAHRHAAGGGAAKL